jgi:hypothetical protein
VSAVTYEPDGLAAMLGAIIEANLERDPSRVRLLRPAIVAISAPDAEVDATLRIVLGAVEITAGRASHADLAVVADSALLLALSASPLRFGLPDVFTHGGRQIVGALLRGRLRVRGLLRHPRKLARLNLLLSVT